MQWSVYDEQSPRTNFASTRIVYNCVRYNNQYLHYFQSVQLNYSTEVTIRPLQQHGFKVMFGMDTDATQMLLAN